MPVTAQTPAAEDGHGGGGVGHLRTAGLAATVVLFTSGHNHMDTGDLTNELLQVLSALKASGIRKSQNDA